MPNELIGAGGFIFQTLTGDPQLSALIGGRVFRAQAPDKDPATQQAPLYPLVLFHLQSAVYSLGVGGVRVLARLIYTVKAVGIGSSSVALAPIVNRIDALLSAPEAVTVTVGGIDYSVTGGIALRPVEYLETPQQEGGRSYSHLGMEFKFFLQP